MDGEVAFLSGRRIGEKGKYRRFRMTHSFPAGPSVILKPKLVPNDAPRLILYSPLIALPLHPWRFTMHRTMMLLSFVGLLMVGCAKSGDPGSADTSPNSSPEIAGSDTPAHQPTGDDAGSGSGMADRTELTPENTRIQFVGRHVVPEGEEDPNKRTGNFEEFTGHIDWDAANASLKSISVEIQTASLTTGNEKLNNHLLSPDFFNANEHPQATFQSTSIASSGEAEFLVTGQLTLLGNAPEIQFPATVDASSPELKLSSEFSINRSEFEMNFGPAQVQDRVVMTITVNGGVE